jgi:hypothetical protein
MLRDIIELIINRYGTKQLFLCILISLRGMGLADDDPLVGHLKRCINAKKQFPK